MPFSDNLYSAEDSDHESFSEELSPSDGYFNRGHVPANVVQDPSLSKDDKAEDKTLIPPPSAQSRTGGSSRTSLHSVLPRSLPSHNYASRRNDNASNPPSSYNPTSPVSPGRADGMPSERSTLIHGPPPAYSASPEVPLPPQEQEGRSYSTFPEQQLERGYLPDREPESMGGPTEEEPNESTPLSSEPKPERVSIFRRIITKILLAALFVAVVISLTAIILRRPSNQNKDSPKAPIDGIPPFDRPIDAVKPYCTMAKYKDEMITYEFPVGNDLSVLQTTHGDKAQDSMYVMTAGEIRLRRLPKDTKHGSRAYFTLDVQVSDPALEVIKTWDEESRLLKIDTPRYAPLTTPGPHCVSVEITAWFPEDAEFSDLVFEAVDLTIRVMDDVKVKVARRSKFVTVAGQVVFPKVALPVSHDIFELDSSVAPVIEFEHPFSSRRILVETVSGSITGSYPLMDYLGISSEAGSINVDAIPEKVLPSAPAPADLEVHTSAGSIKVNCPVRYVPPPRNYITRVHSNAGSIQGSYYLGSISSFRSTAGAINIDGLPVLQASSANDKDGRPNIFETYTISSSTRVNVLDPVFISPLSSSEQPIQEEHPDQFAPIGDDDPYIMIPPNAARDQNLFALDPRDQESKQKLDCLKSTHSTSTSSIDVHYPAVWEGTVHAKSVSGSVSVRGDGIRLIRERKGYASKEILARKGVESEDEGSFVEMTSVAGSLRFAVGE
ncbi:hypothetical protein EG329_009718 [Mollisiaceae sp. DMI_Dod_QoI]|nr:hypothetical protein EG329_009718 [Helotiales sp. DMI_Dod_QoI]